eukprot:Nk52_evm1s2389 gene=Nk52_evmTU1s2389
MSYISGGVGGPLKASTGIIKPTGRGKSKHHDTKQKSPFASCLSEHLSPEELADLYRQCYISEDDLKAKGESPTADSNSEACKNGTRDAKDQNSSTSSDSDNHKTSLPCSAAEISVPSSPSCKESSSAEVDPLNTMVSKWEATLPSSSVGAIGGSAVKRGENIKRDYVHNRDGTASANRKSFIEKKGFIFDDILLNEKSPIITSSLKGKEPMRFRLGHSSAAFGAEKGELAPCDDELKPSYKEKISRKKHGGSVSTSAVVCEKTDAGSERDRKKQYRGGDKKHHTSQWDSLNYSSEDETDLISGDVMGSGGSDWNGCVLESNNEEGRVEGIDGQSKESDSTRSCQKKHKYQGRALQDDGGYECPDSGISEDDGYGDELSMFVKRIRMDESFSEEETYFSWYIS